MRAADFAAKLDGVEYPLDRHPQYRALMADAKAARLLIVYGASDDLIEFDGLYQDEQGAWEGGTFLVDDGGALPSRDDIDDDDELEEFFRRRKSAASITAIWDRGDGVSWSYVTPLPHATFQIMEDGEAYCIGLVIEGEALPASAELRP